MEHWKQFTLQAIGCRNKFQPLQVLHTFLPQWLETTKPQVLLWHILFEPSALVRFIADNPEPLMKCADAIAQRLGLELIRGDTSSDNNPDLAYPGEDYYGEAEFYGESLWKANYTFMQACGELSIEIAKLPHKDQVFMMRKFLHLYGNILGLNYLEESSLSRIWSERSLELYKTVGRT